MAVAYVTRQFGAWGLGRYNTFAGAHLHIAPSRWPHVCAKDHPDFQRTFNTSIVISLPLRVENIQSDTFVPTLLFSRASSPEKRVYRSATSERTVNVHPCLAPKHPVANRTALRRPIFVSIPRRCRHKSVSRNAAGHTAHGFSFLRRVGARDSWRSVQGARETW